MEEGGFRAQTSLGLRVLEGFRVEGWGLGGLRFRVCWVSGLGNVGLRV